MAMQMDILQLGMLGTNCYVLWEDGVCVLIDPGAGAQQLLRRLGELNVRLEAIVLTHGHYDHVGAVGELAEAAGCRVFLPAGDVSLPPSITSGPIPYTDLFEDGDVLRFGPIELQAMCTPGHTPGSSCLKTGNWLFTGDTLFRGSCGRTDLPGGDWVQMYASLRRLGKLEGDLYVYPGHGDASTLDHERLTNPYLREALAR